MEVIIAFAKSDGGFAVGVLAYVAVLHYGIFMLGRALQASQKEVLRLKTSLTENGEPASVPAEPRAKAPQET